jgi:hypothetical protein
MLHLIILFMSQNDQSFSRSISHASLERPPWCGSLDHLVDAVNMIDHRPLVDDHMHIPQVQVPTKQPQGADEVWGLTKTQRQEQCPQSPREIASMLAITVRLRRHGIISWWCMNVLPRCQLPHHLEKRRK